MSTIRLRKDAVWREAGDEILALDANLTNYASTNASGAVLWKALVDGSTREELVELLVTTFTVGAHTAAQDVDAFLDELRTNEYLES